MDKIQITEKQLEELIEYMKSVDEREFTNLSQQFEDNLDIDFDCNLWVWFDHNSLLGAYLKRFWLKGVQGPIPEPPF